MFALIRTVLKRDYHRGGGVLSNPVKDCKHKGEHPRLRVS